MHGLYASYVGRARLFKEEKEYLILSTHRVFQIHAILTGTLAHSMKKEKELEEKQKKDELRRKANKVYVVSASSHYDSSFLPPSSCPVPFSADALGGLGFVRERTHTLYFVRDSHLSLLECFSIVRSVHEGELSLS